MLKSERGVSAVSAVSQPNVPPDFCIPSFGKLSKFVDVNVDIGVGVGLNVDVDAGVDIHCISATN